MARHLPKCMSQAQVHWVHFLGTLPKYISQLHFLSALPQVMRFLRCTSQAHFLDASPSQVHFPGVCFLGALATETCD